MVYMLAVGNKSLALPLIHSHLSACKMQYSFNSLFPVLAHTVQCKVTIRRYDVTIRNNTTTQYTAVCFRDFELEKWEIS